MKCIAVAGRGRKRQTTGYRHPASQERQAAEGLKRQVEPKRSERGAGRDGIDRLLYFAEPTITPRAVAEVQLPIGGCQRKFARRGVRTAVAAQPPFTTLSHCIRYRCLPAAIR